MADLIRHISNNILFLPAKLFVLGVLCSKEVQKIEFAMPFVAVNNSAFQKVRDNIATDKIMVGVMASTDPDAKKSDGVYLTGPNLLKLAPLDQTRDLGRRANVVHESVHAALDIDNPTKPVTVLHAEAAAYSAEAIFRRLLNASSNSPSRRPPSFIHHEDSAMDDIRKAAWSIAVKCVDDRKSEFSEKDSEFLDLLRAIMSAPLYINDEPFWEFVNTDGV